MNTTLKSILAKKLASKKGNKLQQGFTLVELMVVIVIVGILSAVALPQLNAAQDRAKDSVAKQEAVSAAKECSIYLLAGGEIPTGDQYKGVTIGTDCADVTSVSQATNDPATWKVTLTDGIPGLPDDGSVAGGGNSSISEPVLDGNGNPV